MPEAEFNSVLTRIRDAEDPSTALVELTLEQLTEDDSSFGEVAHLAAIPRQLDRDVVATLHGDDSAEESDTDLLERLLALDLVDTGRAAYHDSVRRALLSKLRSDAAWRARFEAVSRRLVEHFATRLDGAYTGLVDVRRVAPMLRRANPERLRRILEAAEHRLLEPALEALYHQVLLDPESGCVFFERLYEWHEARGLLSACRALRRAIENNLQELAPDAHDRRRPWLTYWDGRLHAVAAEESEAEAAYREALEGAGEDVQLRMMALGSLVELLRETYRLGEALELARERLRLARSAADHANELTSLLDMSVLELSLGQMTAAAQTIDEFSEAAAASRNDAVILTAESLRTQLASEFGSEDMTSRFVNALDTARTTALTAPGSAQVVTSGLAEALVRDHPRLALTALVESQALDTTPPERRDDPRVGRAKLLASAYQIRRAQGALDEATADTETPPDADVLSVTASLQVASGDLQAALATWTAVLDLNGPGASTPEMEVLALLNRADVESRLGKLEAAHEDLEAAQRAAARLGHLPFRGIGGILRARLLMDAGRQEEARQLLATAEPEVREVPKYLADHRVAAGRLAYRDGDYAEALRSFRDATELFVRFGMLDRLVTVGGELTTAAADAADWRSAEMAADRAAITARQLAERTLAPTDAKETESDRLYAAGMRALHGLPPADPEADNAADEPGIQRAARLLAECVRRESSHPLYRLGLAYANVAHEAWEHAAAEFDAALRLAPDLFEDTVVAERPVSCLRLVATARTEAGNDDGAMEVLTEVKRRVQTQPDLLSAVELETGGALVAAGRLEEAERAYTRAEEQSLIAGQPTVRAAALARRGALRARARDPETAKVLWRRSVEVHREEGVESPYWALLRDCSLLGAPASRDDYVRGLLCGFRNDPSTGGPMQTFQPTLRSALPETWFAKESITLLEPSGAANVIASSEPLDASIDTAEYARVQGELLEREFPGFEEQEELREMELLGARHVLVRTFSWQPPDGEPVTQIQLYHVEYGRGYTATATTPSARFAELELELQQVLEGLVVELS